MYTDGGSRNNPGVAASAYVIFDEENHIFEKDGKFIGIATNNEAEYNAVLSAFLAIERRENPSQVRLELYCDSQLVVRQLTGAFRLKSQHLLPYISRIKELERKYAAVTYHLISREKNKEADALVNKVLDDRGKSSF